MSSRQIFLRPEAFVRNHAKYKKPLPKINYCTNPYKAAKNVDAILVLAEWKDFKKLDFAKLQNAVRKPYIFDGRNFLDKNKIKKAGFKYFGVGLQDDFKS